MNSLSETFNPKLIVKSWVDSLKIFIPANFKLFALVTLKSFIDGAKVFFSGIFWTGLLCGILAICLQMIGGIIPSIWPNSQTALQLYYYVAIVSSFIVMLSGYIFQFGWLASIRASVDKKDWAYIKKFLWMLPVMIGIWLVFWFLFNYIAHYSDSFVASLLIFTLFMIVAWITIFFFIESGRTVKEFFQSFWRMIIFVVCNLPGLAVFCFLYAIILGVQPHAEAVSLRIIISFVQTVISMIGVCALYNYFIKRFHDHSELYF